MSVEILAVREAVDTYRIAHADLYLESLHRDIPERHTPLLNILLSELSINNFNSLDEFFDASEELNIKELGFESREAYNAEIVELNKNAERDEYGVIENTPEAQTLIDELESKWK